MANPFNRPTSPGVTASNIADEAKASEFTTQPSRLRPGRRAGILSGREAMDAVKSELLSTAATVESATKFGGTASAPDVERLDKLSREFTRARNQTEFASGKLGASIKGMFKSLLGAVGFDTSNIGSKALAAGEVNEAVIKAYATKANMLERIASKPFRVMSKPLIGIPVAVAGLAYGASSYLTGRAERRTQREAMESMAQAQAQAASMQTAAQPVSYKNTVTRADMEAMQARMEADGKATPAFAAGVEAAKEQAPAAMTSVA